MKVNMVLQIQKWSIGITIESLFCIGIGWTGHAKFFYWGEYRNRSGVWGHYRIGPLFCYMPKQSADN